MTLAALPTRPETGSLPSASMPQQAGLQVGHQHPFHGRGADGARRAARRKRARPPSLHQARRLHPRAEGMGKLGYGNLVVDDLIVRGPGGRGPLADPGRDGVEPNSRPWEHLRIWPRSATSSDGY